MVKNESGRSLVETLGMLAIMGILSVVGMAGYNAAMDKNRANTILGEAQKRAVIIAGQIGFNGNQPSLAEFSPYDNGMFDSSKVYYKEDGLTGQFGIKVLNVKKSVCQNILNTIGEKTPIRRLSKTDALTTPITSCDDEADYVIIYNEGMKGDGDTEYCETHADCGECGTCKKENGNDKTGVCVGECESACSTQDECGENDCVVCDSETKTCQNKCDEVEYLESNGSQYIDTGIKGKSGISAKTKINYTYLPTSGSNSAGIGGEYKDNNSCYFGMVRTNGHFTYHYKGTPVETNTTLYTNTDYELDITLNNRNQRYTINGTAVSTGTVSGTFDSGINTYLFAINNSGTADVFGSLKMYYMKIYDNNTLVRDFIPVLSPQVGEEERKACMFDKVSKKLFCGTGTFDYGPKNNND